MSGFVYNGLGDRTSQSVAGEVTTYTLDLAAGLTQVLADGLFTYLYGSGRIAQFDGAAFEYFLPDALGSVRELTDDATDVTLAQSYEPYGDVLTSAGIGTTSYGFTGEFFDPGTQLLYLRARYYAPYLNQFIQPDPMMPQYTDPRTLHRYVYANDNPTNFTDPTGLCPQPERETGDVICVDLFIKTETILFIGLGDNRDFSWNSPPDRSRGYVYIYLDEDGHFRQAEPHINPSCLVLLRDFK